ACLYRSWSKTTPVFAVVLVVPQWLLHRRRNPDPLHIGPPAFDASGPGNVAQYLDAVDGVKAPGVRRPETLTLLYPIGRQKTGGQIRREGVAEIALARELGETPPDRVVPSQRTAAVPSCVSCFSALLTRRSSG